ncbi:unnamed protein product [Callosobruchus maculatus]|uniref:Uncharacterized protein n=1 Tax=Callosobruchus maculatus TaxID=64391 RepID=A0A653CVP6_CALMS|nr:unnamed protein product [Callosobruchus maculatus]
MDPKLTESLTVPLSVVDMHDAVIQNCPDDRSRGTSSNKFSNHFCSRIEKQLILGDWKNELEMPDINVKLEEDIDCEELKVEVEEVIIEVKNVDAKDANRIEKQLILGDWKYELAMPDTKVKLDEDMDCEELKVEVEDVIIKDENVDPKDVNRIEKQLIVDDWKDELEMPDTTVKLEEDADCEKLKVEVEEVIIKDENDYLKDANGEIAVNRIEKERIIEDWKNELEMADTIVKLEEVADCEELKIEVEEVIIKDENDDLKYANGEIAVNRIEKKLIFEDWKDELEMSDTTVKLKGIQIVKNSKLKR